MIHEERSKLKYWHQKQNIKEESLSLPKKRRKKEKKEDWDKFKAPLWNVQCPSWRVAWSIDLLKKGRGVAFEMLMEGSS